jgi:hypothetical protein
MAQYYIASAKTVDDLGKALEILQWAAERALPSGVLAEQVHPLTGAPISVCPLTWSHATVVMIVIEYMERWCQLTGKNPDQLHVSGRSCDIASQLCHIWEDLPK